MSYSEIDRLKIIENVINRYQTQKQAAKTLKISERQVRRLTRSYKEFGALGLIAKHKNRPSNNKIKIAVKKEAINLIKNKYFDFKPTLAHEKLTEIHGFNFSVETLRKWMIAENIWCPKSKAKAKVHQSRPRRSCYGDLIQLDGSLHAWFEDRAANCSLLVFIDDATGKLMELRFVQTECNQGYIQALQNYLANHGRPVTFYSDKHSVFKVNHKNAAENLTQFGRILKTLDIDIIYAHTPQAKGRVERANQTLQDRLVKELRLQNISSIDEANEYVKIFIEDYNKRFAVEPFNKTNSHREVLHNKDELALIFTEQYTRKLTKNLIIKFAGIEYQLQGYGNGYRLRYKAVTVCKGFNGTINILHDGKILEYRIFNKEENMIIYADDKTLEHEVDLIKEKQNKKIWKPAIDHPWKRKFNPKQNIQNRTF